MAISQVDISNRQTVIILWRLGGFAGFSFPQNQHLRAWNRLGHSRVSAGIDHLSKTTKNADAQIPVAIRPHVGRFPIAAHPVKSLVRRRTFPRLRLLARAVRYRPCVQPAVPAEIWVFSVARLIIVNAKQSTLAPQEWIKLYYSRQRSFCQRLIHAAFVNWRASDSVLTSWNKFNSLCVQTPVHNSVCPQGANRGSSARKATELKESGTKSLPRKSQRKFFVGSSTSNTALSSVDTTLTSVCFFGGAPAWIYCNGQKNVAGANETTGTGKVYRHVGRMRAQYRQQQMALTIVHQRARKSPSCWAVVGTVCTFLLAQCGQPAMDQYIVTSWQTEGPAFVVDWELTIFCVHMPLTVWCLIVPCIISMSPQITNLLVLTTVTFCSITVIQRLLEMMW